MGSVVKVLRRKKKPGSIYSAYAIPLLMMFSRRNATVHQYLSYWPNCTISASEGLSNTKNGSPSIHNSPVIYGARMSKI